MIVAAKTPPEDRDTADERQLAPPPREIIELNENSTTAETPRAALSLVIPVYNGGATIRWLVDQIHAVFADIDFEVVLVNDGSVDFSEGACTLLVEKYPKTVAYVHLARNFGEHNAVLAGLRHASGRYVAVLDDDGQNPPHEALRMFEHAWQHDLNVVYGRYLERKHAWLRRLGSWFNDKVANFVLNKPRGIYLSSFKVMSRLVVNEVVKYDGPFPYLDGLCLRTTPQHRGNRGKSLSATGGPLRLYPAQAAGTVAEHVPGFLGRAPAAGNGGRGNGVRPEPADARGHRHR